MGLRDRLAKVFGNQAPADVQAGEEAAGMTSATPFSPGRPLAPYDGYSRVPRSQDYPTGYNISQRPKANERVAFDTLRGLIDSYDVAQMCIWHRINSIRSLDWSIIPAKGFKGDAEEAIQIATQIMAKPDRQTPFGSWIAAWLYDLLAYDAGTLYRMRNRGGRAIGLRVVDGTTIAPLLDYWGNSPEAPAPAYVQYAQGLAWTELTRNDLVYVPFRPRSNSLYGYAPLESILLNANTDLRFQAYFLQRFTDGNIPAAFASAPEGWTPQQIEEFQGYWDAFLLGDQSAKSQIRWMPGGGKIEWSNEKEFSDAFSLFMMRKTCAAYHTVPADLGFTEAVNKSSGETQADVSNRIGDRPLATHVQGIISSFLQEDVGLPVRFAFDMGEEQEDRLALAQAWAIYIDKGMASPDEGREELTGLPTDPSRPVPRFYATSNDGPVPLLAIEGISGKTDPETFGPAQDQPALPQPFVPAPAVAPAEGTTDDHAADAAYDAYQTELRETAHAVAPVVKEATVGVTAETGVTGYDLLDDDEDQEQEGDDEAALTKREMTAFRSFRKARRRARTWRDFEFRHVDTVTGRRLNQAGRAQVRKDAGEIACAGLAVQAVDTGRVLMLQRALDPTDPAGGTWEFPGGHLDEGENPVSAAMREWSEETRLILPFDPDAMAALAFQNCPKWRSGIYAGFVYRVPAEDSVDLTRRDQVNNPDDPDGDQVEALAWWDPEQLPGNSAVRAELLDALDVVLPALGLADDSPEYPEDGTETVCPCGMTARFDAMDGWQHLDGSHGHTDGESVAEKLGFRKAAAGPKGDAPAEGAPPWPGWQYDEACADYWAQHLADAWSGALTVEEAEEIVRGYQTALPPPDAEKPPTMAALTAIAVLLLTAKLAPAVGAIATVLRGLSTDAYAVGAGSARALLDGAPVDLDGWVPGETEAAQRIVDRLGVGGGLDAFLAAVTDRARHVVASRAKDAARILARGTLAGDTATTIGYALREALANLGRARTLAQTETTRSSNHAAFTVYQQAGADVAGAWLIDPHNPCPACTTNGAASPLPLGDLYPSGDAYPPVHPNCRCALVPIGGA
ncbi:phage portal protein [Streptomyces sp. LBUM 1483]|uniref:phage portal protein n=1 Tax=Streptomyces scabiei TaxID=1930 RepID=UPI001B335375|nr:phage portal protein [Streptomyces sp. LBUM 1483]MBP5926697.1 phage portal protein [Streptomyces sp. LBUM 1483]